MIERFYKPDSKFVYVRAGRDADNRQWLDHMCTYNKETGDESGFLELCDVTRADCININVETSIAYAQMDSMAARSKEGKVAILVSNSQQYELASSFSSFASNSSREIEIFFDVESAVKFLNPAEPLEEILAFIDNPHAGSNSSTTFG